MTESCALEVSDLRKTYANGTEALKGISLRVSEGDFFACSDQTVLASLR